MTRQHGARERVMVMLLAQVRLAEALENQSEKWSMARPWRCHSTRLTSRLPPSCVAAAHITFCFPPH